MKRLVEFVGILKNLEEFRKFSGIPKNLLELDIGGIA
jgi:hypothetical protein